MDERRQAFVMFAADKTTYSQGKAECGFISD